MQGDLERSRRLYQTLQLADFSTIDEVRQAYKLLILKYHPDKNLHDSSAAAKFRDVRIAYEVLSNEERKQKYDSTLRVFQPLGANSFVSGARATRSAFCADGGFNPYTAAGTATSSIYEELRGYAARQAERQQRRTSSVNVHHEDRTSQYTKEQQEFFKRREKEHQAEIRKKREQTRREQRERELQALRREQERDEEARKREQQQRASNSARRACSSTRLRRASPSSGVTAEQHAQGGESQRNHTRVSSVREALSSSNLSDTVHAGASPRLRRSSIELGADRVERLRRERDRQADVRRMEQEKYLERLLKQRAREAQLRENEAADVKEKKKENQCRLLFLNETSERQQMIVPQEQLERRRIWRQREQSMRECLLRVCLRQTIEEEAFCRRIVEREAEMHSVFVFLCTRETQQRMEYNLREELERENLEQMELYWRHVIGVEHHRARGEILRERGIAFDTLCAEEAMAFALISIQQQEEENRLKLYAEHLSTLGMQYSALQGFVERASLNAAGHEELTGILCEEEISRAVLKLEFREERCRHVLQAVEWREIMSLIRCRARERQAGHLADEERARLKERQANADTIAALRAEVQRLQWMLQSGFSQDQEGGRCSLSAERSLHQGHLLSNRTSAVLRGDAGEVVHGKHLDSKMSNHGKLNSSIDDSLQERPQMRTPSRTLSPLRPFRAPVSASSQATMVVAAPTGHGEVETAELGGSRCSLHLYAESSPTSTPSRPGGDGGSNNNNNKGSSCSWVTQKTALPLLEFSLRPLHHGCKALSSREHHASCQQSSTQSGGR